MTNPARFTINSLLEGKGAPAASDGNPSGGAVEGPHGSMGLGLEIENIEALPDTVDYARHEFYLANFAASEIAYCGKQAEPKTAFQGLLAAKRAVLKSRSMNNPADGLRTVEISFDSEGRPAYPGCLLSISQTGTIAAAICLRLDGLSLPPAASAPTAGGEAARRIILRYSVKTRIFAFLVLLSLLVIFALVLWKVLEFLR
ncbi:MAG TPA: 4'-phosphopantetheinyl transferase superfamily protein [Methylocella sp.]|nr:4'-phosphopantetheinyl transferase superfamily protein [Methylocella sp.]